MAGRRSDMEAPGISTPIRPIARGQLFTGGGGGGEGGIRQTKYCMDKYIHDFIHV